jgi:hypothetical protein
MESGLSLLVEGLGIGPEALDIILAISPRSGRSGFGVAERILQ